MHFEEALIPARLMRRYKRFLADVELESGEHTTVHCPNTGAMLGCDEPGSRIWLSRHEKPTRKYPWGWEIATARPDVLVGIHTGRTNSVVREAIEAGSLEQLAGYEGLRQEVPYSGGRFDFLLEGPGRKPCYVEVKSVTASTRPGVAIFPDARSQRGVRHLHDLIKMKRDGYRAVMCYCAQRADVQEVRPADAIDPEYGKAMREAFAARVELIAYRCTVSPEEIVITMQVPVIL